MCIFAQNGAAYPSTRPLPPIVYICSLHTSFERKVWDRKASRERPASAMRHRGQSQVYTHGYRKQKLESVRNSFWFIKGSRWGSFYSRNLKSRITSSPIYSSHYILKPSLTICWNRYLLYANLWQPPLHRSSSLCNFFSDSMQVLVSWVTFHSFSSNNLCFYSSCWYFSCWIAKLETTIMTLNAPKQRRAAKRFYFFSPVTSSPTLKWTSRAWSCAWFIHSLDHYQALIPQVSQWYMKILFSLSSKTFRLFWLSVPAVL